MPDLVRRHIRKVAGSAIGVAALVSAAGLLVRVTSTDEPVTAAVLTEIVVIFCLAGLISLAVILNLRPSKSTSLDNSPADQIDLLKAQNEELRTELVEQMVKLGTAALDLLEANEIKDRFLGMAAHDLRNPINVVRMMSEMLTSMKLEDGTKQEFYKDINNNTLHMLSLINDLLGVSAIASGTVQLKLTQNNIRSGIKNCVRMQQVTAKAKDITLVMEDTEMPDSVFDADRIGQVADNLISNAVKYSPGGTEVVPHSWTV